MRARLLYNFEPVSYRMGRVCVEPEPESFRCGCVCITILSQSCTERGAFDLQFSARVDYKEVHSHCNFEPELFRKGCIGDTILSQNC